MTFISNLKRIVSVREISKLKNTSEFETGGMLFRVKEGCLEICRRGHWQSNSCWIDEGYALRYVHDKLDKALKKLHLTKISFVDQFMLKDMLLKSSTLEFIHERSTGKYSVSFDGEKVDIVKVSSDD